MRPTARPSAKFTSRLCVVALAFWLGGAGCALCCSAGVTTAAASFARDGAAKDAASATPSCHAAARPESGESGAHDSRASRGAVRGPRPEEDAGECCARAGIKSDPARKPRPTEERDAARPRLAHAGAEAFVSFAGDECTRSHAPDERARHVRCRVFLI